MAAAAAAKRTAGACVCVSVCVLFNCHYECVSLTQHVYYINYAIIIIICGQQAHFVMDINYICDLSLRLSWFTFTFHRRTQCSIKEIWMYSLFVIHNVIECDGNECMFCIWNISSLFYSYNYNDFSASAHKDFFVCSRFYSHQQLKMIHHTYSFSKYTNKRQIFIFIYWNNDIHKSIGDSASTNERS